MKDSREFIRDKICINVLDMVEDRIIEPLYLNMGKSVTADMWYIASIALIRGDITRNFPLFIQRALKLYER